MTTASNAVAENTQLRLLNRGGVYEGLIDPLTPIPFSSVGDMLIDPLVYKAKSEILSYSTISEMETHQQIHEATADIRAIGMSLMSKESMFQSAEQEIAEELVSLGIEYDLSKAVIQQNTRGQRGRT